MKTKIFNGEKVKVVKELLLRVPQQGKTDTFIPLKTKEGSWVQVEFIEGAKKGNRVPTTMEQLL